MTKAVVYMAPGCPNYRKLKEFLSGVGVEMEEKCVLTSAAIFEELAELSGQKAIPVTVIDGESFVGFDRRTERRMKRKLGV
ncbi:MAG: glutaredoxin family protein [Candidatus Thorarchaeota archaeon]